jgi:hypothetical protein
MKHFIGAVSATLLVAATAGAQAGPPVPSGTGASSLYQTVSDIDEPYYSEAPPPPPAPIPQPAPRYGYGYGYGPGPDYGYRPPAPVYGADPYRQDPYRQDGYRPDYGYAPAFLPVHAVYAIIRDNGFSPLGAPRQRGYTYVISVLDRDGEDGRLVIDARSGRIIRFVPAFQWGEEYERMRYEPGRDQPIRNLQSSIAPRAGLDNLPPPTVIKADPRLLQATPAAPMGPQIASRAMPAPKLTAPATRPATPAPQTAAVQPRPEARPMEMKPAEAKPAQQTAASSVTQPQSPAAVSPQAPAEQKPAPQILPTETMPPAQGLE